MKEDDDPDPYAAVLADINAKIEELQQARAAIEKLAGLAAGSTESASRLGPTGIALIQSDAFFGLKLPEAISKYMKLMKRPQSIAEITAALQRGGYTSRSQNLSNTVWTTLSREEQRGRVVKISKGTYGLSEWYPGAKRRLKQAAGGPSDEQQDDDSDDSGPQAS